MKSKAKILFTCVFVLVFLIGTDFASTYLDFNANPNLKEGNAVSRAILENFGMEGLGLSSVALMALSFALLITYRAFSNRLNELSRSFIAKKRMFLMQDWLLFSVLFLALIGLVVQRSFVVANNIRWLL